MYGPVTENGARQEIREPQDYFSQDLLWIAKVKRIAKCIFISKQLLFSQKFLFLFLDHNPELFTK